MRATEVKHDSPRCDEMRSRFEAKCRERRYRCTRSQNNHNQPRRKTNKSGVKGVCWMKKTGKWHGQVCLNYKVHHVGLFDDLEEASIAVRAKREELHGSFANHG